MSALLDVTGLGVSFGRRTPVTLVEGVDLAVSPGETLAVVGESGSGKSLSMLAVMGLLPRGAQVRGSLRFDGRDLAGLSPADWQRLRGAEIGMVFQDPMTSLNPTLTVGRQLSEMFELHRGLGRRAARMAAAGVLEMVGVPEPARRLAAYPHQFSGGMRQRVMIGMAVACRPRLLIADEPTTALDVTIQAQVLELLRALQAEIGMALILISHDLGVVAGMADRMAVMYAGRVVEDGPVDALYAAPKMPYTAGLMASVPRFDQPADDIPAPIPGAPPDPSARPPGCAFAPRCGLVHAACAAPPGLLPLAGGRRAACHLAARSAA